MSAFFEHHQASIPFSYSCFDRILFNAIIRILQSPASVVGFLREHRHVQTVTPHYLRSLSVDYHNWVAAFAQQEGVTIVEPPKGVRREEWVEPFYQQLPADREVAVILKSRENAQVAVSYPRQGHLVRMCPRFVWQY
jgi:hypothetical protein